MKLLLLPLLSTLLAVVCCAQQEQIPFNAAPASASSSGFSVKSIARQIELGGATSKATTVYTIQPQSTTSSGRSFVFSVEGTNLSWLDATLGKTSNSKKPLPVSSLGFDATRCVCVCTSVVDY